MRTKNLLLVISGSILFLYACKKDGLTSVTINHPTPVVVDVPVKVLSTKIDSAIVTAPITASIVGKWYTKKIRFQRQLNTNAGVTDTTYATYPFDATDYIQFNSDTSALSSYSYVLGSRDIGLMTNSSGVVVDKMDMVYRVEGTRLHLQSKYPFPGMGTKEPVIYITRLDANNLAYRNVYTNGSLTDVIDYYYTR
jgi:hypothetical protein